MAITLEQFASQLDESGVISAVDIAAFQKSQSPAAESAEDLGKLLVKHKKVTKLQAQLVYQSDCCWATISYWIRSVLAGWGMSIWLNTVAWKGESPSKLCPLR
ncbi:MAG: hypothetical protein P1V19_18630 [Gimesia sp.]|nr:hypothetical protein [Gimesia sp.]